MIRYGVEMVGNLLIFYNPTDICFHRFYLQGSNYFAALRLHFAQALIQGKKIA